MLCNIKQREMPVTADFTAQQWLLQLTCLSSSQIWNTIHLVQNHKKIICGMHSGDENAGKWSTYSFPFLITILASLLKRCAVVGSVSLNYPGLDFSRGSISSHMSPTSSAGTTEPDPRCCLDIWLTPFLGVIWQIPPTLLSFPPPPALQNRYPPNPVQSYPDLEDPQPCWAQPFISVPSFCLVCLIHLSQSQVSHNLRPTADVYTKTDDIKHTGKSDFSRFWARRRALMKTSMFKKS